MRPTPKRIERQRGSVIVETALISLIFFCMLIGILDFGQFLYIHNTLTERAREAVRWASVNDPTNTTSIQNMVLYGVTSGGSVPTSPATTDSGIFNVLRSNVSVSTTGAATQDYKVTVRIHDYAYQIYSPYIAGSYNGPNIYASLPLGINF
jgi:Flp pilus assembly protein TadG